MTPLTSAKLREIVRSPAPCVTIYLPAYRPGEQTLHSTARLLRNFVQDAARALGEKRDSSLLQPLNAMAENPRTDEGCHWGRVLFRSPDLFEMFFLRGAVAAKCFAGARFYVGPLLCELELPLEFYILRISRKHAGFFRVQFAMEPLPMPGNLPDNVDAFLNWDKPDHDRENRSSAGPGANRRIRFGTGTERETEPASGAYYRALDHAIQEFHPKGPLLLAGVEEEAALYRSVSSHPELVAGTVRENAQDKEAIERGYAMLRERAVERGISALEEANDRLAPARFSADLKAITTAAAQGRVARLFLRAGVNGEDLNAAAVDTIGNGGEAIVLPAEKMNGPAAAALRY